MAAFSTTIDKTCVLKLGDKFSYFLRHEFIPEYFFA